MRAVALALLVFAAIVYLLTLGAEGWLGFVNAGAEASMVGAIADWFAVTALFRHPLGLPIPHTALIPRRKDELGRGSQEFVGENFLQEEIIRERVGAAQVTQRVATWASEPAHARRVVQEVTDLAAIGLGKVQDEHIEEFVETVLVPRFRDEPIAPSWAGSSPRRSATTCTTASSTWRSRRCTGGWRRTRTPSPRCSASGRPGGRRPRLNEAVTTRLHAEAIRWIADIRDDPHHHARAALDSMLAQLGEDLLHKEETQARAEALQAAAARAPAVPGDRDLAVAGAAQRAARRPCEDERRPAGRAPRARAGGAGEAAAATTPRCGRSSTRCSATSWCSRSSRYGAELTAVITHTIERWDGKEAARKIELHVGRDLQFIRINGTIVGGLVGVLIHTVAVLAT